MTADRAAIYPFRVLRKGEAVTFLIGCLDKLIITDRSVIKLVKDSIIQPFGGADLSLQRVYRFLKSRCYEDGRADLKEILTQAGLTSNDPWKWNRLTHGVMWDDKIWICFRGENLSWEDVRWRK